MIGVNMKKENTGFKKLKKSGKVWIAIATFAVIGMGTVSVNADDSMSSTDIIVVAEPTTPPVTEEPSTSNTGKDSKPEKPNKGNSTPVFIPTAEKPLVTEGKNEIVGIEGSAVLVKLNDKVVRATANEVGGTVLDNGDIQVKNDKGEVKTLKVLPKKSDSKTLLPVVGIIFMILTFLLTSKKKEENYEKKKENGDV